MKYLILFLSFCTFAYSQFETAPAYQPYNLNFENSVVGAMPARWTLPGESKEKGYYAEATVTQPFKGKYCMVLMRDLDSTGTENVSGTAVQSFDASQYIGKTVRFSAHIRAEIEGVGHAGFYVSERTFQNEYPFINTNEEDPIVFNTWRQYTVEHTITANAYAINIGLFLQGSGKAWIDDINVEVIGELDDILAAGPTDKETANRYLDFAKAYGDTKFFHPSDEIENLEIETYLYHSIKEISNSKDIWNIVKNRITRIAPSAGVYKDEKSAKKHLVSKPDNALDRVAVAKVTNNIYHKHGDLNIGTKRLNIYESRMPREAATYQIIGAKRLLGKKIEFSAMAKVKPYGSDAHAELWFRIDFEDPTKKPINFKMPELITKGKWEEYKFEIEVPQDAQQIRTGLVFLGEGKCWFDNVRLTTNINGKVTEYSPKNNSFDMKWQTNNIEYWRVPNSVLTTGYTFAVDNSSEAFDGQSLLIYTDESKYVPLAKPNEICVRKINDGLWLALPLTVYDDGNFTLPRNTLPQEQKITMNAEDRITKIAVFIEMWNYLRYFSNVNLTETEWDQLFLNKISEITSTNSVEEFIVELNKFLKITRNIRSEAWLTNQSKDYTLPFIVNFSQNNAEVVISYDKQIEKGDRVISIGNTELRKYISKEIEQYPGENKIWKQKKAFYKLAAGDFKSEEDILVERNGEKIVVPISRNLTNREVVIARPYTLEWLDSNTLYIDGTRLNDFEMSELMGSFTKAKGLIIDLRGDALLSEHFLGFFLDQSVPSFNWELDTYLTPCTKTLTRTINGYVKSKPSELTRNIVFLTNETSIGKSETILQIVKNYKIGKIIGEPTAGSYDTMNEVKLPAMFNFSFDIYPMSFENDTEIKYKSIIPDITIKGKDNYPNDPKVIKAIEILKENY